MNYSKQAKKLESFLEEEFKKNVPLVVINQRTLLYKNLKIVQDSNGWSIYYLNGDKVDTFRLKATASLAAKHYYKIDLKKVNEIKSLDLGYWTNFNDSNMFKQRFLTAKDPDRRDLYLCRWELTHQRAIKYKDQIALMFKQSF